MGDFDFYFGCGCGAGVERLGFWEVLFFAFAVMIWVIWYGRGGGWGYACGAGIERLGFWEVLLFVFAVMVWILSGGIGGGRFWGAEGVVVGIPNSNYFGGGISDFCIQKYQLRISRDSKSIGRDIIDDFYE